MYGEYCGFKLYSTDKMTTSFCCSLYICAFLIETVNGRCVTAVQGGTEKVEHVYFM